MIKPKLRFPEFSDSWENYKIEDIFDRVGEPVILDDTRTYREIGIRSHGKGIFYKEEVSAVEIGNKRVFWVEPDCFVVNIVFAWERAVARTTEQEKGMIASHRFPMYKPKKDIVDLDYITKYFITKRGQNVLMLASPGGAGRNKTLGQKEFAKSVVKLPSIPEQQKIADFLLNIDKIISNYEDMIEAWEGRKKSVMQKLFDRKVRFKADDGSDFPEWEEKMLGDIAEIFDGVHQTPEYVSEGIKFVSVENIENIYLSNKYITQRAFERDYKNSAPQKWDVLMTRIGDIGRVTLIDEDEQLAYYVSLALIRGSSSFVPQFFVQALRSDFFQAELWKNTLHTAYPKKINKQDIGKCKVRFPDSIEEQQKIAECLSALDEVIKDYKDVLNEWKELKKGLLQQMFV